MADIRKDLTVALRVTDPAWGRRAAAVAMMVSDYSQPAEIRIVGYDGGPNRVSSYSTGHGALLPVRTPWLLFIDADSYVYGNVGEIVDHATACGQSVALRASPLQVKARNSWNQEAYEWLFTRARLPYRPLGTPCVFLLAAQHADILPKIETWRTTIDRWFGEEGLRLSKSYHVMQAAFALALSEAGVDGNRSYWLNSTELSFEGEPPGIIHHEAFSKYSFPYERTVRHDS